MSASTLQRSTEALRARLAQHDRFEAEASQRRGSVPPPAPPVVLTAERCEQIAKTIKSHALLGMFGILPSELEAFCALAKKGLNK